MTPNPFFIAAVQLLLLLLAVSVHGAAQAWMAALCGDPTARGLGGTSLNPLRHFDVLGSLLHVNFVRAHGYGVMEPVLEPVAAPSVTAAAGS